MVRSGIMSATNVSEPEPLPEQEPGNRPRPCIYINLLNELYY
jgi:hypothetical protein